MFLEWENCASNLEYDLPDGIFKMIHFILQMKVKTSTSYPLSTCGICLTGYSESIKIHPKLPFLVSFSLANECIYIRA